MPPLSNHRSIFKALAFRSKIATSCLEYKLGCIAGLAFSGRPRFGLALPVTLRCRSIEHDRLVTSSTDYEIGNGTIYLDCSSGLPPFLIGVPASWSGSSTVRVPVLPGVPYPNSRDHLTLSSHIGLSRSAFQCRLPVLTSVDVHLCSRSNSRLMLTTKRRMVETQ